MTTVIPSGLGVASTSAEARTNVGPGPRFTLGTHSCHCPWSRKMTLLWLSSGRGSGSAVFEESPEVSGEVALDAALGLALGFPIAGATENVFACR